MTTVKKDFQSRISKPVRYTTSRGGQFIRPFDIVRSERGRKLVDRHAAMADPQPPTKIEDDDEDVSLDKAA